MSSIDLIRAWKDEEYRLSLDLHEQAMLPQNPAGEIEVRDEDLAQWHSTLSMTGSIHGTCITHAPI